ncbi:MAG: CoA pyrophosphatase [Rhizobiaceae bacterium]
MTVLYSPEEFRLKATGLRDLPPHLAGDHLLNPEFEAQLKAFTFREAAVLIGLRPHADGSRIILTQRTANLRKHAGQVAFPGGAIDQEDGSPEIAAMREAQEEIGLDPKHVEPLGLLPDYLTSTGFRIKPVVALVSPDASFEINRDEVDAVFEVPLSYLMDTANYKRESRVWQGIERHYYTVNYEDRLIWGVTAGIIRMMQERFYA